MINPPVDLPKLPPYRLASRLSRPAPTVIDVNGAIIGGSNFAVIAGPCSVESETQLLATAEHCRNAGATILRGGAFKPRSSPYSFQGMEEEGLKLLVKASRMTGLPIVTEVMDTMDIPLIEAYADILQVGTRNSQNFSLLKNLGKTSKPVLLKRGLMTTLDEFLMSAEYILAGGNENVILCERGIRTFETATRNTLDLSAVPVLKERTHLPVIVDPSHAVGEWRFVSPLAKAALVVGADGIMVEVHVDPEKALCDGGQSLRPSTFQELMKDLKSMAGLVGRRV
ncbi:3-deoxy-7-phosphoheptulonate synthase [Thermodesulfobacteriota bacterium]